MLDVLSLPCPLFALNAIYSLTRHYNWVWNKLNCCSVFTSVSESFINQTYLHISSTHKADGAVFNLQTVLKLKLRGITNTIPNIIHVVNYCPGRGHPHNRFGTAVGTRPSKVKTTHSLLKDSDDGDVKRLECSLVAAETEQLLLARRQASPRNCSHRRACKQTNVAQLLKFLWDWQPFTRGGATNLRAGAALADRQTRQLLGTP